MVLVIIVISVVSWYWYQGLSPKRVPKESTWPAYESPEEAGWSSEKLAEASIYYNSLDSTAAMVIYEGKVLVSWGDVTKPTNAHSVRKSFLSALYGIELEEGSIDETATLESLGIDDQPPLRESEKQATILDLLTSRSGVFHEAGQESWSMRKSRPSRESYEAGNFFYYNNWDFNVLGTIFNKETGKDLFEEFKTSIAEPIGMEDFSLLNTRYHHELQYSIHPSYLFRMSARDMARFGQLYLQEGTWAGQQLIPKEWVKRSTSAQADVPRNQLYQYGLMWWVATESPFSDVGLYSAVGRYGQSIDVVPEKNLVFVHRVDSDRSSLSFIRRSVSQKQRLRLLEMILEAKLDE
ncbi:serine hydrolase domain-containing protein [Bacillus solitudinis]|uniref:serine hydrolase domain-containing protein n=1 Tax=Bacillus solitudinis TaxID=2014074 RepID=UPI001D0CF9EB|nr:serine hydrolase [Bacillus solitudinis]